MSRIEQLFVVHVEGEPPVELWLAGTLADAERLVQDSAAEVGWDAPVRIEATAKVRISSALLRAASRSIYG